MSDKQRETLGDSGKEYCNHCAGEAIVDPSVNDQLEAMRKDAARYEVLREYLGKLVVHTDGCGIVVLIEISETLKQLDPGSVDRAMDDLLAKLEAQEDAAEQARREA